MSRAVSLWFTDSELDALRADRERGSRARIWRNLMADARAWQARAPRPQGISLHADDPDYENLYDRFYAIMSDAAIVEHLGFVARVSGEAAVREAAARWLVGLCVAWQDEARRIPDYGSVYATSRLLRAATMGLDLVDAWLSPGQRRTVMRFAMELAGALWSGWYTTPASAGPEPSTHHAHMEWGSLGLASLALLHRTDEARTWLDAAVARFDRDLLPRGLAPDGAQVEGPSFWASTMTARLAFLDALERHEGLDLFTPHAASMLPDASIAAFAGSAPAPPIHHSREMLGEPAYAQLAYHAPALLGLARRHRRPMLRRVALQDLRMGRLHEPDGLTPAGERLRFALGPLAYLWDDPTLDGVPDEPAPLTFRFPSIGATFIRSGWGTRPTVVAIDAGGRVTVHAAGHVVLADLDPVHRLDPERSVAAGTAVHTWDPPGMAIDDVQVEDAGAIVRVLGTGAEVRLEVELDRSSGSVHIGRDGVERSRVWAGVGAASRRDGWMFEDGTRLRVLAGRVSAFDRRGHRDDRHLGYGSLVARAIVDDSRPLASLEADDHGWLRLSFMP
jgi:hypothetical protein